MIEILSDLYSVFITFVAFGFTIAALVIWVMLSIDKKQEEMNNQLTNGEVNA